MWTPILYYNLSTLATVQPQLPDLLTDILRLQVSTSIFFKAVSLSLVDKYFDDLYSVVMMVL